MIKLLRPADVVSMTNASFGFLSIFVLFLNNFLVFDLRIHLSFSFILLALLADGLDGIVARRTSKGELGEYFEAMADIISMGIAPLIFIFVLYQNIFKNDNLFFFIGSIIVFMFYFICAMIRLSAFHPLKSNKYFFGLPASASTIIIIVFAYLNLLFIYLIPLIIIISILMILKIKFIKPDKTMNFIAVIFILLSIIFGNYMYGIFPILLLLSIGIYMSLGPFVIKKNNKMN
jgi:CDP-diacylglycerol--serine O-phosphatidyltransferase